MKSEDCKRCQDDQRSYGRALMTTRRILVNTLRIKFMFINGANPVDSCFSDFNEQSERLDIILSWQHLKHEIKYVQSLQPTSKCTASKKSIDRSVFFLKTDIEEFYNIFGNTALDLNNDFIMMKMANDEDFELEKFKLITRFCSNTYDLYYSWEELYERMKKLREMIQPSDEKKDVEKDYVDQIYDIYKDSTGPYELSGKEIRDRLNNVRKNNRKLNLILRESDFDLTDLQLERLKYIDKIVASQNTDKATLLAANRFLSRFKRHLTNFRLRVKLFRMKNVKQCLFFEKIIMHFMAAETIISPDFTNDAIICRKISDFFEMILDYYKVFSSEENILRMKFNEHWECFMSDAPTTHTFNE